MEAEQKTTNPIDLEVRKPVRRKRRATQPGVVLLSCALLSSGCLSSYTVSLDAAVAFNGGGRVRTVEGPIVGLKDLVSVEPLPPKGKVLYEFSPTSGIRLERHGFTPSDLRVLSPSEVRVGEVVHLRGMNRTIDLPRANVRALRVSKADDKKTALIAIGAIVGVAALAGTIFGLSRLQGVSLNGSF